MKLETDCVCLLPAPLPPMLFFPPHPRDPLSYPSSKNLSFQIVGVVHTERETILVHLGVHSNEQEAGLGIRWDLREKIVKPPDG